MQAIQETLPPIIVPERKPYGIRAFDTIFSDEPSYHCGDGTAYAKYGIDRTLGCVVIVRPDQQVSGVYGMSEFERIGKTAFIAAPCPSN